MGERTERFSIDLDATPEQVWRSLTTAEGLAGWFGTRAEIDLRVGGDRVVGWGPGVEIRGRIDAIDPARRLRVVYVAGDEEAGAEEWLITVDGTTTCLTLIHSMPDAGIDDWEGWYGDMRRGWRLFLASLRHGLEDASAPNRTVRCRNLPAPGPRDAIRTRLDAWRSEAPPELERLAPLLDDPPHSLLLASADRTLLVDIEGTGDGQVVYVQAATHGADAEAWVDQVLAAAEPLGG